MNQPIEATPGEWTYSEYARLPDDGNRYEIMDGEVLVTPAPSPHHQKIIARLLVMLIEFVEGRGLGWVFQDVDLLFVTGQFLRPDLLVVPSAGRDGITDRGVEIAPALVIEVLSPSSRMIDRVNKPRRYLEFGVPAYWVVDRFEGVVWTWDTETGPEAPRRETSTAQWSFAAAETAFEVDIGRLIAPL